MITQKIMSYILALFMTCPSLKKKRDFQISSNELQLANDAEVLNMTVVVYYPSHILDLNHNK